MHLHVIYASTSGHVEYVVGLLEAFLKAKAPKLKVSVQRVERAEVKDLTKGDVLLLASSTWNTGGIEGQLNPHMHVYLKKEVIGADLKGKRVALIGLGDKRYRYTCRAADHLEVFVKSHNGKQVGRTLRIVNEPFGQESTIEAWGAQLLKQFSSSSS